MEKNKENNFWKTALFSGIGPVILTSLTTFLIAYMRLIADRKTEPINFKGFSFSADFQYTLLLSLVIFISLLTLKSIKNGIVKYNDSKQEIETIGPYFSSGNLKGGLVFTENSETNFL